MLRLCTQARPLRYGRFRKGDENGLFCSLKFNRGHETEKDPCIFLSTLDIRLVLQLGDDGFSGIFRKTSKQ